MKTTLTVALVAAMTGGSLAAQAYDAGDWIVRAGAVTVAPDENSDAIALGLENGVSVDDDTQLSIIGAYMFTDNFALELLAATPFEHDLEVKDLGISAGSVKQLPPTLSLQWYPRGGQAGWQPYLGVGLNYTIFFDESVASELEAAVGNSKLSLDNSFGLSAQAGLDVPLSDNWGLNVGVWYIDIDTTAKLKTEPLGTLKFDVDVDPWVYNLGITYKF